MDFGGLSFETLVGIAKESTDSGLLDEMVKEELRKYETAMGEEDINKIVKVLCAIGENISTKKKTLDDLSSFPHSEVRRSVARNIKIWKKTIEKLSKDSVSDVRLRVALTKYEVSHQDILQQIMEENYNDTEFIFRIVQWSKAAGQKIFEQLIHYKRDVVNNFAHSTRQYVAAKLTNPEKLDEMYDDDNWIVKLNVVENPNTHKKTIIKIKEGLREDEPHVWELKKAIQKKLQES